MSGTAIVPTNESLERFINRKRLFVRVQANVDRALFVQRITTAFQGARVGTGSANERGPVTQRVADINYDSAAEATQALRRTRFKLRVGSHDADITYQIERKDVVDKLAGEWGCRFMCVVKNLPPGEISCSELCDLFETAGEVFTIKILPGNRGEPYALVQYVEEPSVELAIQQINQQKFQGAVLYVERHLKARRQGATGASAAAPPPNAPPPTTPSSSASHSTHSSGSTPSAAVSLATAVAGTRGGGTTATRTASAGQGGVAVTASSIVSRGQVAESSRVPAPVTIPAAATAPSSTQLTPTSSSPVQTPHLTPASTSSPPPGQVTPPVPATPTSTHTAVSGFSTASQFVPVLSIATPMATADQSARLGPADPPVFGTSAPVFGTVYTPTGATSGSVFAPGPSPASASAALSGVTSILGGAGTGGMLAGLTSTGLLGGGMAAAGTPGGMLRLGNGAGPGGVGAAGGLLGLGGASPSQQHQQSNTLLTPMLDLFSHLREPHSGMVGTPSSHHQQPHQGDQGAVRGHQQLHPHQQQHQQQHQQHQLQPHQQHQHGGMTNGNGMDGYGLMLRGGPGTNSNGAPLMPPGSPPGMGIMGPGTSLLLKPPQSGMGQGQGHPSNHPSRPNSGLLSPHQQGQGQQAGQGQGHPQQQGTGVAAAAASLGLARISIRDALRLALGRLEEMVTCPITGEIMRDPVVAADGCTYERAAIQNWMGAHGSSPVSGEPLGHSLLVSNKLAASIIMDILPADAS